MASRSKEKQRIALIGPHFDSKFHMPHELTIQYNDDILASVGLSEEAFAKEATFLLAAKLYEQGKLSSGQAAQLCGKGRAEF